MPEYGTFDHANPRVKEFYNTLCKNVYGKSLDQVVAEAKGEV